MSSRHPRVVNGGHCVEVSMIGDGEKGRRWNEERSIHIYSLLGATVRDYGVSLFMDLLL